jgi:glyoxylate carboligase
MENDGRCNCIHDDNKDVWNPPSTLEQLLIVEAQLLRTMQQLLVQMQDVNQLMQSMEARTSSRKRKSNTHDDPGKAQKISETKEAIPNHNGGSTTCFNCGKVGYFAHRCSQDQRDRKWYNCGQKGHFTNSCTNPRTRPPLTQSSTSTPPPNPQAKEKEKVHPED